MAKLGDRITLQRGKNRGTKPRYMYDIYDKYFDDDMEKMLELGIEKGRSLRHWKERYPNTQIYGLDLNKKCFFEDDRIKCFIGNMADPVFLQSVVDETGLLDVIIDDGAHQSEFNVPAFHALWPYVKSGGFYVVEDLHIIAEVDRKVGRRTGRQFTPINQILQFHSLKAGRMSADREVDYVHWWESLCIIGKK